MINNSPLNAGSVAVPQGLLTGIREFGADPSLVGIVIIGDGNTFLAGDIREFDALIQPPSLPDVIRAIEAISLPVVAAIHGSALGGGFELALGCDGRVAASGAAVGLPEVSLGMIPGAGGTQRIAYVTGKAKAKAIDIVTSSRRLTDFQALELGLIDQIVVDDVEHGAASFVKAMKGAKRGIRDREFAAEDSANIEAATDMVNLAGQLPFDNALAKERAVFNELRASVQARALRHLFFAERASYRPRHGGHASGGAIRKIGVLGAETMGVGIAGYLADAGYEVLIFDKSEEALSLVSVKLSRTYQEQIKKGKLSEGEAQERLDRVKTVQSIFQFQDVDLAIEAVFEESGVKRETMSALRNVLPDRAILASNTSYLDLNNLAEMAGHTERTVGLHFFSPAQAMRLLEIVQTRITSPEIVNTAIGIAKRLGKVPVVSRVAEGFIGNRIFAAYTRQCEYMVEEGGSPEHVDTALENLGFATGPFAVADLSGLDIVRKMRQHLNPLREPARYVTIADSLCELGLFGRKSGAGYYSYGSQRKRGTSDPAVHTLIDAKRSKKGIVPRKTVRRKLLSGRWGQSSMKRRRSWKKVSPKELLTSMSQWCMATDSYAA
ncbi:3-hydroxyacyl-CoA dehydrogenase NAD-binding domain-containing protein [Paraburkholderia caribensis]|uniref:3-hydroxyacyl-CoA dehydrogenase NAD-binding domain-containing protein n=1 Tax=Paraburkholderia caribensis TaxID=75105 RepID=UPI001F16304E|nr:3-hydroxyacyl-CoA dehydrogenase NAD-binding domain-containing protein [Paraburkholderia caribensis]